MIAFIVNALIKNKSLLLQKITRTFATDYEYSVYYSNYPSHNIELAKHCAQKGYQYIIAVGGDGTLFEVVNGIMQTQKACYTQVCVGVLPTGTGNDFVRSLGGPITVDDLKKAIDNGKKRKVDLGYASFYQQADLHKERYFINMANCGLGGIVAKRLIHKPRRFGARLTYLSVLLASLWRYQDCEVLLEADTFSWQGSMTNLVIANGKYFAGGLGIASNAKLDDGLFEIVILQDISILDLIKQHSRLQKCQQIIGNPKIRYERAKEITVKAINNANKHQTPKPLYIEMDGEFVGRAQGSFRMLQKSIQLCI